MYVIHVVCIKLVAIHCTFLKLCTRMICAISCMEHTVHVSVCSSISSILFVQQSFSFLSATKARSRALPCCTMASRDNQRLEPCVPVLYYNVQLVNQSAVPDNLVREACQRLHYQVNFVQS